MNRWVLRQRQHDGFPDMDGVHEIGQLGFATSAGKGEMGQLTRFRNEEQQWAMLPRMVSVSPKKFVILTLGWTEMRL